MNSVDPIVRTENLSVHFELDYELPAGGFEGRKVVKALDGLNIEIMPGEILSVVGESGSGKTTLGRAVVGLIKPTVGSIMVGGVGVKYGNSKNLRELWRKAQMIFQDPYSAFNPLTPIYDALLTPLRKFGLDKSDSDARSQVDEALIQVGLDPADLEGKYPHQLSGGQRQRLSIARALVVRPQVLVADEPVSMLDVSLRAGVLDLLRELNLRKKLTIIFITHDLAVAEYIGHRIAVMYKGEIVELAPTPELIQRPIHPYTELLLSSVPRLDGDLYLAEGKERGLYEGDVKGSAGCRFYPRCPLGQEVCVLKRPRLAGVRSEKADSEHHVSCHVRNPGSTV